METSAIISIIGIISSIVSPLVLAVLYSLRKIKKSSCCGVNIEQQVDEIPIATVSK